jgi:carbonic anhydrase
VEFLILGTVMPMVPEEVAAFHEVYDFNYRPVQDLNGRTLHLMTESGPE